VVSVYRRCALAALTLAACNAPVLELPPPKPRGQTPPVGLPLATPPSSAGLGRARVSRIGADAPPLDGPEADGRAGDFRLENNKVAFVIDGASSAIGFADSGGNLVDAAPLSGCGARACRDSLKQLIGCLDDSFPRQPLYDRVEAATRGPAALVRASGHDSGDPQLAVETEYVLQPGSNALEITTIVTNHGSKTIAGYQLGDTVEWGRAERFTPGHGFEQPGRNNQETTTMGRWIAGLADEVSYLYVADAPEGLRGRHGPAWSSLSLSKADLAPGATARIHRFVVVGSSGDPALGETLAQLSRQSWPRLEGRVTEEGSGSPLDGARIFLDDRDGRPLAFARSAQGRYQATVPPGDYQVRADARGRNGPEHLAVQLRGAEEHKLDFTMSKTGWLSWTVHEGGAWSPAKLTFLGDGPTRSPSFGPRFEARGHNVVMSADGRGRVEVPPGEYVVIASRGPEMTVDVKPVKVTAGQDAQVDFTLERAVDTHGFLCVDLHQHAQPSPDSGVTLRDRAIANLAEGLEVMVATDHNAIADWQPTIDALGAARPLRVIYGDEATRDGIGHFNAYPLEVHPAEPRGGALDVRGLDAAHILAGLRAADHGSDRVLQVNHPRVAAIGYFNTVKLDARPDTPLPAGWDGSFDAIEVLSSKDITSAEAPLRDWYSLLNRGLFYTAVGGSDSHLVWGQEVGYPRTCVAVPADYDPKQPGPALVDGIKRRRDVLVTNGPFVRVQVAGRGMGQVAPAPRGKARLDVEVQAAPWVEARKIDVLVDGERRGKPIELPQPKPGSPLRWKGSVELKVAQDAYVTVEVRGDLPLTPILGQPEGEPAPLPFAVTNPIYLDRDLDGKYTRKR
jgi:hypothetical protein